MSNRQRRGGLGRGLGALIPTAPPAEQQGYEPNSGPTGAILEAAAVPAQSLSVSTVTSMGQAPLDGPGPVPGASFAELPVTSIHPNARQPRQVFDEDALAELTHSIREFGVLQPVVVRADASGYELVMGERRLRAAAAAGHETIPAIIRTTGDDAMLRDALLENIHRAQLNPLEEAAAYQQLLEEFGTTHDELAQRIGRSRPQVSNTIRLLNLPLAVQRRVAAGVLSAGHARALLGLDDRDQQDELAGRIVAEGLSVRATEELVSLAQHGGAPAKTPRSAPVRRITAPGVAELAGKLSDVLDTRVRVDIGRRKGKITVEFATIDDLERIVGLMAPQLETRRSDAEGQSSANEP
jgi:ParB family chromosome partitioning protein